MDSKITLLMVKMVLFFEPGQAGELKEKLRLFMESSAEQKENMSSQAVKTAKLYSVDEISQQLPTIFFNEV
ncbi:hypothetical protein OC195_04140 [Priestia flexa]|nr:hypothetical protein OC195_04140 [Priestia flexa]